ncbi:MAG TPA: Holliday junction branch migration protein RuvA [Waddliaceae bacterium]
MYEFFRGNLIEKCPHYAILDVQGVGYKLHIPVTLLGRLPDIGEKVFFYTSWVVREMSQTLYGFDRKEERDLFDLLLTLSGIGPKTALGVIGHFELSEFEKVIREENAMALTRVPGIGKKTAERLMIDLRDRLKLLKTPYINSKVQDAMNALLHLGCSQVNAQQAIKKAVDEMSGEYDLSSLITTALKYHRN